MRDQHAEAAAVSPETIYPERQEIAVDSTTDRYLGELQEIPIKGLGIQPKTELNFSHHPFGLLVLTQMRY